MRKIILVLLVLSGVPAIFAASLEIVRNGKSDYSIVINSKSPSGVRMAANDLQEYIRKATGANLPVVSREQPGEAPAFLLGFIPVDKPENFMVRTAGRNIHISGYDTEGRIFDPNLADGAKVGTWYGVSDFLEKQLGVRWFMPGELGEYVPHRDVWTVPELNYTEAPRMEYRSMTRIVPYPINDTPKENVRAAQLFLRRNRDGNVEPWCGWHSWRHDFPAKKYFAEHPEWFAMVDGRRSSDDPGGYGLKMCTTNPEALDQYAKNLIAARKGWKQPWMLSLTPNDSGNFCECEKCTALDDGIRPDGSRIITTRIVTYANEVARRVRRELPDQKFGLLAYAIYYEGVSKVKVDPSITVTEVLNDTGVGYYDPARRAEHRKNLKAWREVLEKLYYYCTPAGMGGMELPCHQFENIKMLFDDIYAAGVTGIAMNNGTSFSSSGLNNYFYLKFAWAPPADPEKLYSEALRDCYGPVGAPVMREYTAEIEKRLEKFALAKMDEDISLGYIKRYPGIIRDIYPGLAEAWLPKLKEAAAKTPDRGQQARLQTVIDNLEYCMDTVKLYQIATQLISASSPDPRLAATADNLAAHREELLQKQSTLPGSLIRRYSERTEKMFKLPFDRKMFAAIITAQAAKRANAERGGTPPAIDGKLDDDFWKKLPVQRIDTDGNGVKLAVGADVRIAVTEDALYLGIHCEEPLADKIADTGRQADSPVWNENCFDVFIDPSGQGQSYYQLVFNSLGTARSFKYFPKSAPWESGAEIKTSRDKNSWTAEVRIPLASLTAKANVRGDIWGVNFCRIRHTVQPAEYSCWSPTFGSFHRPERFGKLVIK